MTKRRPRYETQRDRDREATVAQKWAAAFNGVTVEKLAHGHDADFLATDSRGKEALVEIKTRTCTSTNYPTYHVSADKLRRLRKTAASAGRDALLVVQWRDRIGYISVNKFLDNCSFKEGGRWDRGDKYDVETMADIEIRHFKFI
jgi:hypothetical protein